MIDYQLLALQNPWWHNRDAIKDDQSLLNWRASSVPFFPKEILDLKLTEGAIHIVYGPRQTGKSTAVKLLIKKLLESEVPPEQVLYFNCDILEGKKELIDLVLTYQESLKEGKSTIPVHYLFLDEISAVSDWPLGIKWLYDGGFLKKSKVILTGSSSINLKKSGEFLPARRGKGRDIKLLPITFGQYVNLLYPGMIKEEYEDIAALRLVNQKLLKNDIRLAKLYQNYLKSGGFLKVIDLMLKNESLDEVVELYKNTVRSELYKFGKKEIYLRKVMEKIVRSLTSETSYTNIAEEAELGSKNTAIDYLSFLTDSFFLNEVLFYSISEKKILLKKNKKFYSADPFFLWIFQSLMYGGNSLVFFWDKYFTSPLSSHLAENFVASEIAKTETDFFYSKNNGELDFYLPGKKLGIEVKYKDRIVSTDLFGLKEAKKKILVSKNTLEERDGILIVPIYLFSFLTRF